MISKATQLEESEEFWNSKTSASPVSKFNLSELVIFPN